MLTFLPPAWIHIHPYFFIIFATHFIITVTSLAIISVITKAFS